MRTGKFRRITILVLVLALGAAAAAIAQPRPSLTVDEPVKDIGAVRRSGLIRQTFVLRNEGNGELRILSVEPDCGCTVVSFDRTIAPGASGDVTADIDLSSFVGPVARYLKVLTNDPANPQVSLTVKADVRPQLQSHPGYARFVTVTGDGELTSEQTVWASDYDDLEVLDVQTPYRFLDVEFHEATGDEKRAEATGRQWAVVITLAEDARIGPIADRVTVQTNHPERPRISIPVSGFVRPVLAVNPPAADFGRREGIAPIVSSVHVKNFSDDEIELLGVTSEDPSLEIEIKPEGRDHYLIITVPVGAAKGEFSSLLTVQTNSSRMPTLEVEVRGTIL